MTNNVPSSDAVLAQQIKAALAQGLPDAETVKLIRRIVEPSDEVPPGTAWERHDDPEQSGGDRG